MPTAVTTELVSARSVIGSTLAELGAAHPDLWVLTPDIGGSLGEFRAGFPDRFVDVGLAEQACVGIAAGLAYDGKTPVVFGMLPFLSMRALEQIRTDVCYPNLPVKIVGSHGGLVGNGGSTHYAVEDIALMLALTNMTVTSVADPLMVGEVLRASMDLDGPIYVRIGVGKADPIIYEPGTVHVKIGKGIVAREGRDLTIMAHGTTVHQALQAAELLAAEGIDARVIDMFTIKPLDEELVLACAAETGAIVVVEDHLAYGGLGSRVADLLMDRGAGGVAFERLGIPPVYAGFGPDAALREKHGYGLSQTVAAARRLAAQKEARR
ncbi:transketolase family protein [Microbacterium sp. E-13]|uniref:transketolase family protein n=1 Tax=Microbacterium sp. E-13 TaxID=3404048 RepID=UPI003CF3694A